MDEPSGKIQQWALWCRVAIVLLTLATLWPVLLCSFGGWDDDLNVTANPWLNPPSWQGVARFWREPAADLYVPVTYTTWSLVAAVTPRDEAGRMSAWEFHLVNLIAHVWATICAFEILRCCTRGAKPHAAMIGALAGAMLFAVHPVQVEPVAWVAGLKDVLAGALALAGIALFVCDDRRTMARSVAITIIFAAALLAKPSAVAAPIIALLIDVTVLKRSLRRSGLSLLPSLLLIGLMILVAGRAQPAQQVAGAAPLWKRFFIAGDALAFYFWKVLLPIHLGVDYGRTPQAALSSQLVWTMWLIPAALIALAAWCARRGGDALPLVAIVIFIVGVGPVLGLVPFDFQAYSTVADHYLYIAMLGPALLATWLVARHPRPIPWIISATAIVLLATLSFLQTWTWRDTLAIARQATRVNPRSFAWHDRAAMSLFYDHGDIDAAIVSERKAIEANPNYTTGWQNLGLIFATAARHAEAVDAYQHALALDPNNVQARIGLANALAELGQSAEAIEQYRAALQHDPSNVVALSNLAGVLASQGKLEEAIDLYRRAIFIDGNFQPARQGLTRAIDERAKRGAAPATR